MRRWSEGSFLSFFFFFFFFKFGEMGLVNKSKNLQNNK